MRDGRQYSIHKNHGNTGVITKETEQTYHDLLVYQQNATFAASFQTKAEFGRPSVQGDDGDKTHAECPSRRVLPCHYAALSSSVWSSLSLPTDDSREPGVTFRGNLEKPHRERSGRVAILTRTVLALNWKRQVVFEHLKYYKDIMNYWMGSWLSAFTKRLVSKRKQTLSFIGVK